MAAANNANSRPAGSLEDDTLELYLALNLWGYLTALKSAGRAICSRYGQLKKK